MQAPDRVFLKRAAECERIAELTRDPRASLFGGEWQTDGIGVRKWLRAPAQKRHTAPPSPKGTGKQALGHLVVENGPLDVAKPSCPATRRNLGATLLLLRQNHAGFQSSRVLDHCISRGFGYSYFKACDAMGNVTGITDLADTPRGCTACGVIRRASSTVRSWHSHATASFLTRAASSQQPGRHPVATSSALCAHPAISPVIT